MKTCFHGTSYEALQNILQNGFDSFDIIWNCSDNNSTYFWSLDSLINSGEIDEDLELDYQKHTAICKAFESATVTTALTSKSDKICVIEVEFPDDYKLEPDHSCPNMDYGAVEIHNDDCNLYGRIIAIHTADFSQKMSLFYISGLVGNHYIDLNDYLTDFEVEMVNKINHINYYIDEMYEFEYVTQYIDKG